VLKRGEEYMEKDGAVLTFLSREAAQGFADGVGG
jgi:hypothetical protein